ncbi:MAG: DUF2802 domain-containing protein [Gammaproteobacteria bacterium]|jgi:hypothetical protein
MLEFSQYYFEFLFGAVTAGLGAALYFQRMELRRVRSLIRCERADREALAHDVAALLNCSQNIGVMVKSHDETQHNLLKKLDVLDLNRTPAVQPAFERVHKLVAQGLGIDEIADICDLGRGEVELLSHMAERRSAA